MQPPWNVGCKKAETKSTVHEIASQPVKTRMLPLALSTLDTALETRSRYMEMYACVCVYVRVCSSASFHVSTNVNMKCAVLADTALSLLSLFSLC